jgi:uncharacterized protein (TIGR04255 family)
MEDAFPIPFPDPLPKQLDPCPLVEAILEIRFVTKEPWATLPGLLHTAIRERYPDQISLPASQIPEEIRKQNSNLTYLPLLRFLNDNFIIQLGPRVVSLVTQPHRYPGWHALAKEMEWLMKSINDLKFIEEGERLGVRYVDFFGSDIFPNLILGPKIADQPLRSSEMIIASVLRHGSLTARLQVANSAVISNGQDTKAGSVIDIDVWINALDFELFESGLQRFAEAHHFSKQIFFGLLKSEFLATLNPSY